MPTAGKSTALKIDEITEFSLVPRSMGRPANEHAQISITKTQEGGAQMPPNEGLPADVQKAISDALAIQKAESDARIAKAEAEAARQAEINKANSEEIAKMKEAEAFAKCEARITSQGINKALAPDFRAFEKSNPDAAARIESEMARLVKVASNVSALTKSIGEVTVSEGSPQAKLEKAISEIRKANPKMSREEAYLQAYDGLSKQEQLDMIGGA